MTKITQIFKRKPQEKLKDLGERMVECSNEELIRILQQRTYYRPEAARLALEEAIRRGIINSEQDLLDEEYRVEEMQFSWFPVPDSKKARIKTRKSIGRSLVVCGLIPVVFGFLEINTRHEWQGNLLLAFGLIWIFLSAQLLKAYHHVVIVLLFLANITALVFVFLRLLQMQTLIFMDFFVALIIFLLITYGLLYIRRIATPDIY